MLLVISSADASDNDSCLNTSIAAYLDQIFGLSENIYLKNIEDQPKYQNREQYISSQWKISPSLQVVTTKMIQDDGLYMVDINVTNNSQALQSRSFSNQNLALAMRASC